MVQYKVEISATSTAAIGSQFWIVNNSINQVNLNDLTLRYYFTNEVAAALIKSINWANVGALGGPNANFPPGDISVAVVPMAMPVASADTYVEFGFNLSNPMLSAGHRVQFSWTVQNFASQKFNQPGDYSFNAGGSQMDWPNVVLFQNQSVVVWGMEP